MWGGVRATGGFISGFSVLNRGQEQVVLQNTEVKSNLQTHTGLSRQLLGRLRQEDQKFKPVPASF